MVHLPHLGKLRREVKEEVVDADGAAVMEAVPFYKRSRLAQQQQQWSMGGARMSNQQPLQHDFLEEPSPLGLRLKKSPSLVELIQMKLAQASKATEVRQGSNTGVSEKLKASNFPGSVLRIGSWEWVSRYEGDLVAKCYFAKHKLVWEVLDGGLKSKIEIQWSDICGIKMFCPENETGTLEIALSRRPLFFRETNPEPRKHTLWQATSDFTGGQASLHREHFLQCPLGLMNKHMEKLVHCDPRLYSLSQRHDITLENPYFESKISIFEDPEDMKCQKFEHKDDDQFGTRRPNTLLSPQCATGSLDAEARPEAGVSDVLPGQFTNSVSGSHIIKQDAPCDPQTSGLNWNGFMVPGIKRPATKSEIVNNIGNQMFKQLYPGSIPSADASVKSAFDEFTQYLLSDSQMINNGDVTDTNFRLSFEELTRQLLHDSQINNRADEKMLMSRVNSLCCLIQRDSSLSEAFGNPGSVSGANEVYEKKQNNGVNEMYERKLQNNGPPVQKDGGIVSLPPRQESFGDLLTNLPRISSFPNFL